MAAIDPKPPPDFPNSATELSLFTPIPYAVRHVSLTKRYVLP